MQVQKVIERLGYTAQEAKVYLAALGLGEAHITDVAAKAKLPRSSTQVIVDKLHKDGLLNFYVRRRYRYWVAERPQHLLAKLEQCGAEVRAVLPQLEALRRGEGERTLVKIYQGVDEIRLIYDDMLELKQHISGIVPWDEWVGLLGRGFMEDFIEKRKGQYLRFQLLIPRTAIAEELHSRDGTELRETRFLPERFHVKTTTLIYGSKAAIVSLNKKMPTAVLIDDEDVRDTLVVAFTDLWERSTSS